MKKEYVTVKEVAAKLGISPRAVHFKLKAGLTIPHVKSYRKASEGRTSAYIIRPMSSFWDAAKEPAYDGTEDFLK